MSDGFVIFANVSFSFLIKYMFKYLTNILLDMVYSPLASVLEITPVLIWNMDIILNALT